MVVNSMKALREINHREIHLMVSRMNVLLNFERCPIAAMPRLINPID